MTPEVSIVLPFRNAADTLEECLDSIQQQSLTAFELIALDDGSSDGSAEILSKRSRADSRVILVRSERHGIVAALNTGLGLARSVFVARMDADDIMGPRRLELQSDYLQKNREVAVLGCRVELFPIESIRDGYREYVRWQNACIGPDEIADNIYVESPFAHPSVMMRRSVVERMGGYAEGDFPEDYDLWLRMNQEGIRMAKLPDVLLSWRERPDRVSRVDHRYSRESFDRLRADYLASDPRLTEGRPVVVWGAGRRTRQRARRVIERGVAPTAWIDIDPKKIGHSVWGIPVESPQWLEGAAPRPFVLVYVTRHGAREEVESDLQRRGWKRGRDYLAVG